MRPHGAFADLTVRSEDRVDVDDVTADVAAALPDDLATGLCTAFVPPPPPGWSSTRTSHACVPTCGSGWIGSLPSATYRHDRIDDNADAHLRAALLGESVTVPVPDGELALGTWQSILFVECDGPRSRDLCVTTVPAHAET